MCVYIDSNIHWNIHWKSIRKSIGNPSGNPLLSFSFSLSFALSSSRSSSFSLSISFSLSFSVSSSLSFSFSCSFHFLLFSNINCGPGGSQIGAKMGPQWLENLIDSSPELSIKILTHLKAAKTGPTAPSGANCSAGGAVLGRLRPS